MGHVLGVSAKKNEKKKISTKHLGTKYEKAPYREGTPPPPPAYTVHTHTHNDVRLPMNLTLKPCTIKVKVAYRVPAKYRRNTVRARTRRTSKFSKAEKERKKTNNL